MMAEVFHIIYDLEHNLQRTSSQITIGGQSTGVISYKPNKQFAGKPLQPVKIHIGDRIMSWKEEKQKLFFPEQYAITKEVMKKHLVAFLHTKKL